MDLGREVEYALRMLAAHLDQLDRAYWDRADRLRVIARAIRFVPRGAIAYVLEGYASACASDETLADIRDAVLPLGITVY